VEDLSHVVNFDVPHVPDDYIHRVGRTARAEATGDAFTFVSNEEAADLAAIERAIGKRLPRVTVPDFDYTQRPAERLEIPIAERIAAIRARKSEERARAREKADRRAAAGAFPGRSASPPQPPRNLMDARRSAPQHPPQHGVPARTGGPSAPSPRPSGPGRRRRFSGPRTGSRPSGS